MPPGYLLGWPMVLSHADTFMNKCKHSKINLVRIRVQFILWMSYSGEIFSKFGLWHMDHLYSMSTGHKTETLRCSGSQTKI